MGNYMFRWKSLLCMIFFVYELVFIKSVLSGQEASSYATANYNSTSCFEDYECDLSQFLVCNNRQSNGICGCGDGSLWNSRLRQCMRMEGRNCSSRSNIRGISCTANAACVTGKCKCDEDYLPNGYGACHLTHNMPCDNVDQLCTWRYFLECPLLTSTNQNGDNIIRRCKCIKEGVDFLWDPLREKCAVLVGSRCDADLDSEDDNNEDDECVSNSVCGRDGLCHCKPGFTVTKQKTCALAYGQHCDNSQGKFCNKYDFLNCQGGKCNCEFYNQMKYDDLMGKCRILSGEPCGWPVNGSSGGKRQTNPHAGLDDRVHSCVEGAVCIARRELGRGVCACVDGKREAADKTCQPVVYEETPAPNQEIVVATPCTDLPLRGNIAVRGCFAVKPSKRLICSVQAGTTFCTCGEGAFFNGTDCINFPGEECTGVGRSDLCLLNSYCDTVLGNCQCSPHFQLETETSSCKPVFHRQQIVPDEKFFTTEPEVVATLKYEMMTMMTTSNSDDSRSRYDHKSSSDGSCASLIGDTLERLKCFCETRGQLATWSNVGRICVGFVGASCVRMEEQENFLCVENSYCDSDRGVCLCCKGYYHSEMDVCIPVDRRKVDSAASPGAANCVARESAVKDVHIHLLSRSTSSRRSIVDCSLVFLIVIYLMFK